MGHGAKLESPPNRDPLPPYPRFVCPTLRRGSKFLPSRGFPRTISKEPFDRVRSTESFSSGSKEAPSGSLHSLVQDFGIRIGLTDSIHRARHGNLTIPHGLDYKDMGFLRCPCATLVRTESAINFHLLEIMCDFCKFEYFKGI